MRKYLKENILKLFQTLYDAHKEIKKFAEKRNYKNVGIILGDCQEAAVQIGTAIEQSEGEGFVTVKHLEEYCEALYEVSQSVGEGYNAIKAQKVLDKKLITAENSIKADIVVKLEVVFLPYKYAMFDSLMSVFTAANSDPLCDAYLVPIPYYDRNTDGSLGQFHYDGNEYPADLHITHYEVYDIAARKPDIIFIHNGYDECNYVTCVAEKFHSSILKKYTDTLVYIPYYLFPNNIPKENMINIPALAYADKIFVQNEQTEEMYSDILIKYNCSKKLIKDKVVALGSPKTDKIYELCQKQISFPEEWEIKASGKIKLFINTNVSLILNNNVYFVRNIKRIFDILEKRGDVFVIWREHPLSYATIKSMHAEMAEDYENLKSYFLRSNIGVIDTHSEAFPAMLFSDAYFGAGGSLVPIYTVTGKPVMITDYSYPNGIVQENTVISTLTSQYTEKMYILERFSNSLNLFLDNIALLMEYKDIRLEQLSKVTKNIDGSAGKKIWSCLKSQKV